ncbi:hypothetical protein KIN20_026071 [Parelaphostrongylus tenuis]|uniref:Transmembrane protein n=1 Tax=Parelaphostrongylus tenuis TaxID=148309 RepID=A0AAD5QUU9_PARTN|nr:hypothetical protein KIN20_026071 [Parelaphostrongylus tenuis]
MDINDFDVKSAVSVLRAAVSSNEVQPCCRGELHRLQSMLRRVHVSSRINKKQSSASIATLTSRYQTRENVITTQFAAHIATLQIIFFIFYGVAGTLIRVFSQQLFGNNKKLYISLSSANLRVSNFLGCVADLLNLSIEVLSIT